MLTANPRQSHIKYGTTANHLYLAKPLAMSTEDWVHSYSQHLGLCRPFPAPFLSLSFRVRLDLSLSLCIPFLQEDCSLNVVGTAGRSLRYNERVL